ncbi:MAG: dihydroorotate dehydrogenase (quinone), partial [Hyphomicrobium sp.]
MLDRLFDTARPLLFMLQPEDAHEATLKALETGIHPRCASAARQELAVPAFGLDFPNPLGVAAGFDKDARVPDAVL